jgi:NAD+ synthase
MRKINITKEVEKTSEFIKKSVKDSGFKSVVVGLSGGIDSAVSASLAVRALGKENVYIFIMPYKDKNDDATKHAFELIGFLDIPKKNVFEINIAPMVDSFSNELLRTAVDESQVNRLRLGNIMARVRMIILFDFAKKNHSLVLGTENKSEHYLGYFTRYGDEASDIEPVRHLYKTEIFMLGKYLKLPEGILTKAPTAGLWQGQTDEGEFGFTYGQADEIIYGLYEAKKTISDLEKQGIDRNIILKVKNWVEKMSFKHRVPIIFPEK